MDRRTLIAIAFSVDFMLLWANAWVWMPNDPPPSKQRVVIVETPSPRVTRLPGVVVPPVELEPEPPVEVPPPPPQEDAPEPEQSEPQPEPERTEERVEPEPTEVEEPEPEPTVEPEPTESEGEED